MCILVAFGGGAAITTRWNTTYVQNPVLLLEMLKHEALDVRVEQIPFIILNIT